MTVVDSASDIVVLMLVFDSHRQPLNGYYLGALLFYDSKRSIGGASFLSKIFWTVFKTACKSHCRTSIKVNLKVNKHLGQTAERIEEQRE